MAVTDYNDNGDSIIVDINVVLSLLLFATLILLLLLMLEAGGKMMTMKVMARRRDGRWF